MGGGGMGLDGLPELGWGGAPRLPLPWLAYWYEGGRPSGCWGLLGFMGAREVLDADACWAVEALEAESCEEVVEVVLAAADDEGGWAPLVLGAEVGAARLVEELLVATLLLLDLRVEPTSLLNLELMLRL